MKERKKIHLPDGSSTKSAKRILLFDLRVLYNDWVKETKHEKVPCFAFFCQLKPDECVFAGDPGTHNICVCDRHENLKLKSAAGNVTNDYRELIAAGVCSINNKKCMIQECDVCPGKDAIREFLTSNMKIGNAVQVQYSNWTNVPIATSNLDNASSTRMTLKDFEVPYSEFVDNFIEDIWNIRQHHFIASEQKNFLQ